MSLPPAVLTVRDLGVTRGGRALFSGLGFVLRPGELITLTGPNGSGKSTLMRILAGLTPRETGSIAITGAGQESAGQESAGQETAGQESAGQESADDESAARTLIHYHGHREALREALTAQENLAFATALAGGDVAAVPAALHRMAAGRLADLPVRVLSAGQRRRVALCRLLTTPRPIWLLDEPLAALDVAGQALVAELVKEHLAQGGSALVATHQPLAASGRDLTLGGMA